jgi:cytochrome c oxidase subunit II
VTDPTLLATVGVTAAGSLDPQGPVAEAIADLWWLMLALGAAAFLVFAVLLGLALVRRWAPPAGQRDDARHWLIIGAGVVLPFVLIVVVYGATLATMRAVPAGAGPGALEVEVVGHQFWYEIRYPEHDVVTANELHLPVGRQVALRLSSADVIHSFWIPPLAGKLDMLPERTNTLVLRADEPGEHRSRCAEFCGLQHTRMGLIVVAEAPEDFSTWIGEQQDDAGSDGEEAERGRDVFTESGCVRCHAAPGVDSGRTPGPDLTQLPSRRTLAAATLPNTRGNAAAWIRDPEAVKRGVNMPAADDLSDDELDALLDYLGYAP